VDFRNPGHLPRAFESYSSIAKLLHNHGEDLAINSSPGKPNLGGEAFSFPL
jgi:hypothetical protein